MTKERFDRILFLLIFVSIVAFYWLVTTFDFLNFDDPGYVTQNPNVQAGLTLNGIRWAFHSTAEGHWHPLTWISHMIDVSLFGMEPWGHHLMNLFFFAANAGLIFLFLCRLGFALEWSVLGVLFFALHPLRLETFAWISERKDVLSFFFGMLSILNFISFLNTQKKVRSLWFGLALIFFILSLLSKPTFVSLPILLAIVDRWKNPHSTFSKLWLNKIPFFIIAACSSIQALLTQRGAGAIQDFSLSARLETAVIAYGTYFGKFFIPLETSVFYPHRAYALKITLTILAGLLVTTFYFFKQRKNGPHLWLGWLWFLVAAIPVSGIVSIGGQEYADRWTYLPQVGILIGVLACVASRSAWSYRGVFAVAAVTLVAFVTFQRMPDWKNSESLFRHALEVDPDNFMAHTNLGVALEQKGNFDEATDHYEAAYRLNPTYAQAVNNLGLVRTKQNRMKEAAELFGRASQLDPSLITARQNLDLALQKLRKN